MSKLKRHSEESLETEDNSDDSASSAAKIPKVEFVAEFVPDEEGSSMDHSSPIDFSMDRISTDNDTASEVEKSDKSSEKLIDDFQIFCQVCLKQLHCGADIFAKKKGSTDLPAQQCFMCPRAIYCKDCIYSINHLKLHTQLKVDIPLNKSD